MKTTPRFVTSGRAADTDVAQLLRPVPSVVADAVGEPAEQHAALARRYGEACARLVACPAKIDDVERADDEAARRAIAAGKPLPKAKLPIVQEELAEAERELALVTELVRPSAEALLAAALEVAQDVASKTDAEADAAVLRRAGRRRSRAGGREARRRGIRRVIRVAARVRRTHSMSCSTDRAMTDEIRASVRS